MSGYPNKPKIPQDTIEFLKFCKESHTNWAEFFEGDPEEEAAYMATGEWYDAETHRMIERRYITVIAEIESLRQAEPFTVQVEIPKTTDGGFCSDRCLLKSLLGCKKELSVSVWGSEYTYRYKPGPPCPRYEAGK